jgi:polar amino acid transport system substrate-binding protein
MNKVAVLIFITIFGFFIQSLAAHQSVSAKDITYLTEQFPPYNYQENGKLQGISLDLLEKMWEKMNVSLNRSNIKLLSWTEGYQKTLNESNTVLFSTARLPERENLFKWVGPIGPLRNVLLAKEDKNISIAVPEDLKKYKIAAISDDSAVQMLLDKGAKKEDLVLEKTSKPIIEMLQNGSIDAWAYGDNAAIWLIKKAGANAKDFKVVYMLGQIDYYFAFNKETPDYIVQSFQQAIDKVKSNKDKDGVSNYEKILSKYPG